MSEDYGLARFHNSLGLLAGKGDERARMLCACHLARKMVWHLFTEPECKQLIHVAEEYARGNAGGNERRDANRIARRWCTNVADPTSEQEANREAMSIAYSVTCREPFSVTALGGVAGLIVGALIRAYLADHPGTDWPKAQSLLHDNTYEVMAELVAGFVETKPVHPKGPRSLREDPELRKYRVKHSPSLDPFIMRDWVLTNVTDGKQRERYLQGIACFLEVARKPTFSVDDLAAIQLLGASANRGEREMGVQLLLVLGMHNAAARDILFLLLKAPKLAVRFTMITFLEAFKVPCPMDFFYRVIAKGLEDISARVREFAAVASWTRVSADPGQNREIAENCVPLLLARLQREANEKVKGSILFAILRLRPAWELRNEGTCEYALHEKESGAVVCKVCMDPETLEGLCLAPTTPWN